MRTFAEEVERRKHQRVVKIASHRALRPRDRAAAAVKRLKRLGIDPSTMEPRELTDDEIAR